MKQGDLPTHVTSQTVDEVLKAFDVSSENGLDPTEVQTRREKYGPNRLQEAKQRSAREILIDQFKSPIIGLLAIAAVLSFLFQEWIEGVAIMVAILLNAGIGFFTEMRAVRSMKALKQLSRTQAKVRRDGEIQVIPADELVPGDLVVFEGGDLIPADLRLIETSKLQADESALTGESVPVSKQVEPIDDDLPLAERTNTLFKGTFVTRGSGEGVAIATGMDTELGHISSMTAEAEEEITPLEKRLDQLGRRLIWVTLAIAAVVAVAGIIGGKELFLMIETAIALSVAAVPEGLPIVATVALARGMWRMANRNALINQLSAVETLGATTIICTDKTGTLTENRMTVTQIALESDDIDITGEALETSGKFLSHGDPLDPSSEKVLPLALQVGVLCNNAVLPNGTSTDNGKNQPIGDPMEVALLVSGAKAGFRRDDLLQDMPEVREVAFDPDLKMMTTVHQLDDQHYRFAVKGAPESVLPICTQRFTSDGTADMDDHARQTWHDRCTQMAEAGLRILAIAMKDIEDDEADPYENLTLLGVVGLEDPPRDDVREAIAACHQAGVRVIMVTGDQPITARNIGLAVGLVGEQEAQAVQGSELKPLNDLSKDTYRRLQQVPIFARVSPEEKLNLIAIHQNDGSIVAMTGDGVNDAPALKKADIGIAMGQRGTQVAKEASDMVLQDDAFSTIVAAVEQGRAIFRNIRKFTIYLLSGNMGEIIAVGAASLTNSPLPLLPLQILFINAVNDVFPALALGVGEGNPVLMKQPPRDPKEPVLANRHWWAIGGYGFLIAGAVLSIFALCLDVLDIPQDRAVTISFLSIAFGRLWHVFNMRDRGSNLFRNEITKNPYIWGALLLCTGLLLFAVYFSPLAMVLQLTDPGLQGWGLILAASLIPLLIGQVVIFIQSSSK
ncbi:MAG: cation-translocating P-type ATPase [Elainellaceae cyanobacterium]